LILFLFLLIAVVTYLYCYSDYVRNIYIMPNGVKCYSDLITGGGFGGATHEFYLCDDEKTYINPEHYETKTIIQKGGLK